ncbi:MAG: RNA polymerase sigma factor [Bacteroidota bacterium]
MIETNLIKDCIKGDRQAQSTLYAILVPKMFAVCLRYSKSREEAEEILQEGFLKTFQFLHQCKQEGSLEGWVRKIMVNCALQKLRSKSRLAPVLSIESYKEHLAMDEYIESNFSSKELLKLVMSLPPAYNAVFNLYVFEGVQTS